MPESGLNGHSHSGSADIPPQIKDAMLARIEKALAEMAQALLTAGFSAIEVSEVNLSTRYAITSAIKERRRG